MRVGVIARPEDRGLGLQTWEFFRHMDASALVVDVREQRAGIVSHWDRFPGARTVTWCGGLNPAYEVCDWLETVDVVYTAETFYDDNFTFWARERGAATVCHLNPEFWRPNQADPSAWWSATSWRIKQVAEGTQVVPYPVDLDRFCFVEPHGGPTRWLHVAGRRAMWDRNGTQAVVDALQHLERPCSITIAVQDDDPFHLNGVPEHVTVRVVRSVPNYWETYQNHDALVMPRRYGGLCLPVQEAMASGMAVAMSDREPNLETWPVAPIPAGPGETKRMFAGEIPVASIDPRDVARVMDDFTAQSRQGLQERSRQWAIEHSWKVWAPRYRELMADLAP